MRDEIPGARLQDEAERIERAAHDLRPLAVARSDTPASPDGRGERREVRRLVLAPEPAAGVQVEQASRPLCALLELRWQRGQHLQAGVGEDLPEAELRRRADEQRLRFLGRESGQSRPIAAREPVTTRGPSQRLDRNARLRERLRIPLDRALGHAETFRKLGRGELSPRLEDQEQ